MLTADHVRTRKKDGELVIRRLDSKERTRALELAGTLLDVGRSCIGRSRDELDAAWAAVPVPPRDRKLGEGLKKLIEDETEFAVEAAVDPVALRSDVFLAASAARGALAGDARFDRDAVLAGAATRHGIDVAGVDKALYADLKGEQILLSLAPVKPEHLVERYDTGQVQAVLLRAVRVVASVRCATPASYRALFRALKFRRLMHRIERGDDGAYRIEIDGPYSLFESVTKYGLELALVLPALEACDSLELVAHVRWGKQREPLVLHHASERARKTKDEPRAPRLRDDVVALAEGFRSLDSPWQVRESDEILEVPGGLVCVPDLVFEQPSKRRRVYFEALGFWNRDAVWKRIDFVKEGLAAPILFAASSRLRVSETLLDDSETAALYVYKGTMNPRAVLRKLDALTSEPPKSR